MQKCSNSSLKQGEVPIWASLFNFSVDKDKENLYSEQTMYQKTYNDSKI